MNTDTKRKLAKGRPKTALAFTEAELVDLCPDELLPAVLRLLKELLVRRQQFDDAARLRDLEKMVCGPDLNAAGEVFKFLEAVRLELARARSLHPHPQCSLHHAYAVLLEEVDEFWDQVRLKRSQRSYPNLREELVQIAAMCARTELEVVGPELTLLAEGGAA